MWAGGSSEPSGLGASSRGCETQGRATVYRLRDLLGADFGAIRAATRAGARDQSRALRAILARLPLVEHHGRHRTRVLYCPPLPLLWSSVQSGAGSAAIVHRTYLRELWAERGLVGRALLLLEIGLLWPGINLIAIAWATRINGAAIRRRTGRPIRRQALEQLWLSMSQGLLAPWYYTFDLHDDRKRRLAPAYLRRDEIKGGIYRLLKSYPADRTCSPLKDKVAFAERCRVHGVRAIPVLAVAEKGEIRVLPPRAELPRDVDFFLKPSRGRGGAGAECWHRAEDGSFWSSRGGSCGDLEELLEHLRELSLEQAYIVTPRLVNHAELADLNNGALSTVRIVTLQDERGGFEATDAVLRMAVGSNHVVDNFHAGGIAAPVHLATGELGSASDLGLRPECGWRPVHPDTGACIAGRKLPFWGETVELVQRAHEAFSDRVIIGWDVAILEDGPCIVEGNGAPDLDIHQRCGGAPLGDARLGELLAFHVGRTLDARDAQKRSPRPPV